MAFKDRLRSYLGLSILIMAGLLLLTAGCQKVQTKEVPPVPSVEVAEVVAKDVPIYSEWTASTDGFVNATIRAQVQGYLVEQDYKDGDFVLKGQILFKIDPRTFQAALEQARGQLTEQMARWENARANLERIKPLVEQKAVSMKDFDEAVGTEQATHAAVIAAQAVVDKAQLDLGFTKVISPIDGIAGIARTQLGNLVGPGSIEELTMVSTVDPIKVFIPMSEQEYLKYVVNGHGRAQQIPLELILADEKVHPYKGTFAFAARSGGCPDRHDQGRGLISQSGKCAPARSVCPGPGPDHDQERGPPGAPAGGHGTAGKISGGRGRLRQPGDHQTGQTGRTGGEPLGD